MYQTDVGKWLAIFYKEEHGSKDHKRTRTWMEITSTDHEHTQMTKENTRVIQKKWHLNHTFNKTWDIKKHLNTFQREHFTTFQRPARIHSMRGLSRTRPMISWVHHVPYAPSISWFDGRDGSRRVPNQGEKDLNTSLFRNGRVSFLTCGLPLSWWKNTSQINLPHLYSWKCSKKVFRALT